MQEIQWEAKDMSGDVNVKLERIKEVLMNHANDSLKDRREEKRQVWITLANPQI